MKRLRALAPSAIGLQPSDQWTNFSLSPPMVETLAEMNFSSHSVSRSPLADWSRSLKLGPSPFRCRACWSSPLAPQLCRDEVLEETKDLTVNRHYCLVAHVHQGDNVGVVVGPPAVVCQAGAV